MHNPKYDLLAFLYELEDLLDLYGASIYHLPGGHSLEVYLPRVYDQVSGERLMPSIRRDALTSCLDSVSIRYFINRLEVEDE